MKLLLPLLLLGFSASSQKKWYKITNNDILVYSLMTVSGAADGVNQAIVHHEFGLNNSFWDFKVSWKNKYRDWDAGDKSAAFFGSKTVFVGFTDGFHLTRTIDRTFTLAAVAVSTTELKDYEKKDRWKVIAKKAVISALFNRLAFTLTYSNFKGPF